MDNPKPDQVQPVSGTFVSEAPQHRWFFSPPPIIFAVVAILFIGLGSIALWWIDGRLSPSERVSVPSATFPSKKEAQLDDVSNFDVLVTGGFDVPGDGGAAVYKKINSDTASKDGDRGGFRDAGGNWWELDVDIANVKIFGAKGDGVVDDAPAINGAIAAAKEKTEGRVYLPSGTYLIRSPITLLSGTHLRGDGGNPISNQGARGSDIRAGRDFPDSGMINTDPDDPSGAYTIESLLVDGAGTSNTGRAETYKVAAGLRLRGKDVLVGQVGVEDVSGIGVHLLSAGEPVDRPYNYIIVDSHISKNGSGIQNESAGALIFMSDLENNNLGENFISNTQQALGGNVWLGNHLQACLSDACWQRAVTVDEIIGPEYSNAVKPDQFIGNLFQKANVALRVRSASDSIVPAPVVLKGNHSAVTGFDVSFDHVRDISLSDLTVWARSDSKGSGKPSDQKALKFTSVTGGVVEGVIAHEGTLIFGNEPPSSVAVLHSMQGNERSYGFVNKNENTAPACIQDGAKVENGASKIFYSELFAQNGDSCDAFAKERMCANGALSGPIEYQYASCAEVPKLPSTKPWTDMSVYDAMNLTHGTLADAKTNSDAIIPIIKTAGYSKDGDGGGAVYVKIASDTESKTGDRGGFRDAGGNWWKLDGWPLNAKWFGAAGDGKTADDGAINDAIQAASDTIKKITGKSTGTGGSVYIPSGIYTIKNPIILQQNLHLFGDGTTKSVIRAGGDFSGNAMVRTSDISNHGGETTATAVLTLEHLGIDGVKDRFTVDAGLRLLGRNMRIADVAVKDVSGTGIRLDGPTFLSKEESENSDKDKMQNKDDIVWINTVSNTEVTGSSIGFFTESSDSWYWGNRFADNDQNMLSQLVGDTKFFGNTFVGGSIGHRNILTEHRTRYARMSGHIMGNLFDGSETGLEFTNGKMAEGGGDQVIPSLLVTIDGNTFRNNKTGITFSNVAGVALMGSRFVSGPETQSAIAFDNVFGGLIKGLITEGVFPEMFHNKPSSVKVVQ